jgi:hypothetical protein
MGYTGSGTSCALEDECSTGNHRCGGGTCSNGAALGYSCTCAAGWTLQSGTFPQCYKSGTITFGGDRTTGIWGYDFMMGKAYNYNNFQYGDFYVTDNDSTGFHTLWANNLDEQGVVAVSTTAPLLSVKIPSTGFTRFGVVVEQGGTYVSYARNPNANYYIVLRVTALPASGFTADWVLVYRPPGSL